MSWQREDSRDGLSIWRGRDSIVNLHQHQAWEAMGCGIPGIAVTVIMGLVFLAEASGKNGVAGSLGTFLGYLVLLPGLGAGALIFAITCKGGLSTKTFFDEAWTLREQQSATFQGLTYRRMESGNRSAESWSAPLADIARVEAGSTQQWISSRRLGNVIHPVSEAESQVFLFMNDGSRRVICSINGNREMAAMLAQSVRSWFEAEKAKAVAQSGRARSSPPGEWREGFDI
jgi:hypothetical protein